MESEDSRCRDSDNEKRGEEENAVKLEWVKTSIRGNL